jgi:thioesterase domain-containing protein
LGPCLTGDFECRLVPGKHFTIFDEPLVAALAQQLSAALERASSGPARSDR